MNDSFYRFDTFAVPTDNSALSLCLMDWLPNWVIRLFLEKSPIKRLEHVRATRDLTRQVAKQLLNEKYEALAADKPKRDIMSLLGTLPSPLFVMPAYTNLYHDSESKYFGKPEDATRRRRDARADEVCMISSNV